MQIKFVKCGIVRHVCCQLWLEGEREVERGRFEGKTVSPNRVTPVGVMFMVMSSIAEVEDITNTFISLGFFVLLNVVGQITHFIFLMLSLVVLCKNPFTILKLSFPSYFIAFATTSA